MLAPFVQALTSRVAGPVAAAVAVLMSLLLVVTWVDARRMETRLQARVAELTREANSMGAYWQARATRCEDPSGRAAMQVAAVGSDAGPEEVARRLAEEAPAGLDVCARMESADQAVLNTLK